jgi:hypothetical protein
LQQRPSEPSADIAYANGRHGYLTEIQSHIDAATNLYTQYVSVLTPEEGFLMALNESEQREILDFVRYQAVTRDSLSPLRKLGEHNANTIPGFEWAMDGNLHVIVCFTLALLGYPPILEHLETLSNADLTQYPDRGDGKKIAIAILTAAKRQWSSDAIIANLPNLLSMSSSQPVSQASQVSAPPLVVTPPVAPVAAPQTSGPGLYSEVNDLRSLIRDVTNSLSATTKGA